jgi:hypothetical protein
MEKILKDTENLGLEVGGGRVDVGRLAILWPPHEVDTPKLPPSPPSHQLAKFAQHRNQAANSLFDETLEDFTR